ncbi:replicative DNA helicase [Pseudorhodobacter antarcticus]|uniref:Replicative DNA helicase n=1 Tax=Pseudorhodobacter antarcticus TaxID=1077947 RepID=A0A1H8IL37_9RHOB|nr:AAA family ATPase [Pseudorhodobacter antarcticus]SEN68637.1 replicative DNA helicase [Pseudorhodobacter antarcticus]
MIDLQLLRILKHKSDYLRIRGRVPTSALDPQTNAILADFGKYFDMFPDQERIDHATFLPVFRSRHPNLTAEQSTAYDGILSNVMTKDVPEDVKKGIMRSMLELRMGTDLANLLAKFDAGDLSNIQGEITRLVDGFKADAGIREIDYIRDDIGDLLREEIDDSGLSWRLECLNQSCRGLRGGDFGIIAGRPDKGKTTFIASELTHLAAQLPTGQNAIWLNNEGPGKRIIPRLYQAALGATMSELIKMDGGGNIRDAYISIMGAIDRIRVIDVHNADCFTVEGIIEKQEPGLVVYDMIDNIRGFGDSARTDLGLERMYQWGRELAVKYDHAGLATSQISNEGDGLQFPTLGMLKDSKTGKQGACDFMMMIGASNDPGLAGVRYIGMPKNKIRREGAPQDPRATVQYSPQKARYEDIPYTADTSGASDE